jgi:hypothetical protein
MPELPNGMAASSFEGQPEQYHLSERAASSKSVRNGWNERQLCRAGTVMRERTTAMFPRRYLGLLDLNEEMEAERSGAVILSRKLHQRGAITVHASNSRP